MSFADHKARMKDGQSHLPHHRRHGGCGQEQPATGNFGKRGIEVLLMTDRVDRMGAVLPAESSTARHCKVLAKGAVDWANCKTKKKRKAAEEAAESFKPVLEKLKGKP